MEISTKLIYRKIEGELSEEENRLFEAWLAESELHRHYFEEMKKMYESPQSRQISEEELEEAWSVFSLRLKRKKMDYWRRPRIRYWGAIAGVAIVCMGIFTTFIFRKENRKPLLTISSISEIKPGHVRATLELSDGTILELGKVDNNIQDKSGVEVKVDSSHLTYALNLTDAVPDTILHRLVIPRGGEYTVNLEDGSRVFMNSDSKLSYSIPFKGTTREVVLEGEAYFEVKKDSTRPFIVHAGEMNITVLGTSFGVTCYKEDAEEHTTLVSGRVEIKVNHNPTNYILEPGMHLAYDKKYALVTKKYVDVDEYVAWQDGKYVFKKKRLEEILSILSRWYNFTVFYQNAEAKESLFSGELKRFDNFNYILHLLEEVGDVRFVVDKNIVKVLKQ